MKIYVLYLQPQSEDKNNEYRFGKFLHHQAYHQNNDDVLLYA
ncbi:hypothetical protein SAMN06264346_10650 [Chryseobacterium profundimaris]|uniref:Uncharacterized protein n=1 Tax=Chryseobacterium profundimaris TaxID=1387275 RepID=A0ABY1NXU8_9FLAO|nr:hypothetical protein SAMN06264346_10650 [Chryseobacterium profundimaris]